RRLGLARRVGPSGGRRLVDVGKLGRAAAYGLDAHAVPLVHAARAARLRAVTALARAPYCSMRPGKMVRDSGARAARALAPPDIIAAVHEPRIAAGAASQGWR